MNICSLLVKMIRILIGVVQKQNFEVFNHNIWIRIGKSKIVYCKKGAIHLSFWTAPF